MHNDFQVIATAQNIFPNQARGIRFFNGSFNLLTSESQFAAHIDKGDRDATGIAGDDDPLDQLMRIFLHQHAVFEGAWLALVAVAAEVTRLIFRKKSPLHTRWEARASTTAQARFLHQLDDIIRLVLLERLCQALIAAMLAIPFKRVQAWSIYVFCNNKFRHIL